MTPFLSMCKVSARWCSAFLGASIIFGMPSAALAQTSLTWAKVERLRNRVHLIPNGYGARLARVADVMNIGDALRTSPAARAELRFNDGSLARVGEQATFRFTPNTRNFQLSNGTVLLLIPPGHGRTTIQTPNAVTGIQGSALFVRVRCLAELSAEGHCSSPVTLVGALTNNPAGAMIAFNESGSQQQPIYAGEMVVIEGDDITDRLEFDLKTFYQTSGLVEGLYLDSPTPPDELSEDLQGVWQEIQDALELQGDFDSQGSVEEIVENPAFLAPTVSTLTNGELDLDEAPSHSIFADFPGFSTSPAAVFHNEAVQVASSQSAAAPTAAIFESLNNGTTALNTDATNARLEAVLGAEAPAPAPAPVVVLTTTSVSPSLPPEGIGVGSVPTTAAPVEPPVTPVVVTAPEPVTPVTPVVVTAPEPVTPVTPVVTTATPPADTPATPVVTTAAPPVDTPATPVVTAPEQVDTPTNPVVPTLEADAVEPPERNELSEENFNWDTPATDNPEVLQTSPNIDIGL